MTESVLSEHHEVGRMSEISSRKNGASAHHDCGMVSVISSKKIRCKKNN